MALSVASIAAWVLIGDHVAGQQGPPPAAVPQTAVTPPMAVTPPVRPPLPPTPPSLPPPVIEITGGSGEPVEPLAVTRVEIAVTITGFMAQTRTTLTFHNPHPRILEGELVFPLPEGATVSGYALDVNGEMADAVVVERHEARIAFEKEVRRGVDPGLVEWVRGNNFRTRVYPLPANGTRTVRIEYVSDLVTQDDGTEASARYLLPLRFPAPVAALGLRVEVVQAPAAPEIRGGELANFRFDRWEDRFVAETHLTDVRLDQDLTVALPHVPRQNAVVERAEDGEHYFVIDDFPPAPASSTAGAPASGAADSPAPAAVAAAPQRVALLWDASLSRARATKDRELSLVRAWLARLGDVTVDLVVFRDVPERARSFDVRGGDASALLQQLEGLAYDGATDLGALRLDTGAAYAVLVSDGLGTIGEASPQALRVPVFPLSAAAEADHAALRHLAETTGGAYFNLSRLADEQVVTELGARPYALLAVDAPAGTLADVSPSGTRPVAGRVTVTGRLTAPEARVTLRYGRGTGETQERAYVLRQAEATTSGLVARLWAQQRVSELAVFPERNHDELLSLGRRFGIVTPGTSLLVLERLDQYLEHGIEPPASRGNMRAEYLRIMKQRAQQKVGARRDKLEGVVALWQQRLEWWQQDWSARRQMAKGRGRRAGGPAATTEGLAALGNVDGGVEGGVPGGVEGGVPGGVLGGMVAPQELPRLARQAAPDAEAAPPPPPPPASAARVARVARNGGRGSMEARLVPADAEAEEKAKADEGRGREATITIQAWDPKTPYLAAMKAAGPAAAYATYLTQRERYFDSPGFYLDCADHLLRVGQRALGRRVLTNIVELKLDDPRLLRVAAHRLQQIGAFDLAIELFGKVLKQRPEEPQSPRDLALALAARGDARRAEQQRSAPLNRRIASDYLAALRLINDIVLTEWDGRFEEIELVALMDANRLLAIFEREKLPGLAKVALDSRLRKLIDVDVRIVMTWDTDQTDMDLWVIEPTGEKCFYGHRLTAMGGMISRDFTGGYGPEEYLVRHARGGVYKVQANFYGSRSQALTGPTTVQATVVTNFGRANEKRQALTLRLTGDKEVVDIGSVRFEPPATPPAAVTPPAKP